MRTLQARQDVPIESGVVLLIAESGAPAIRIDVHSVYTGNARGGTGADAPVT